MTELFGLGIGFTAIMVTPLMLLVIFYFENKAKKEKYAAMIEISKNMQSPAEIRELLDNLEEKKASIDYRRSGVMILFVGLGLFLFGSFSTIGILKVVGLLVAAIGIGSAIAGYLYPNESVEITKVVEKFEER